jgi:hypothetical protein
MNTEYEMVLVLRLLSCIWEVCGHEPGCHTACNWYYAKSALILCPKSKSRYNWRSVSQYVKVSSPLWDLWPDITFCPKFVFWKLLFCLCGAPNLTGGRVYHLSFSVCSIYQYLHQAFTLHVCYTSEIDIQYIQSFFQSRLSTADYALLVTITWNYTAGV